MKRLTSEEVRVDESVDRYLGPLADLEGMKPKLLDLILNGPVLNGVSKDVLRQIIRQLYSALAAYEGTGLEPESVEALKLSMMGKTIAEIKEFNGLPVDRLRELAEADKDGRLVVLPCKVGDTVYFALLGRIIEKQVFSIVSFSNSTRIYCGGTSEYFRPEDIMTLLENGAWAACRAPQSPAKVFQTQEAARDYLSDCESVIIIDL